MVKGKTPRDDMTSYAHMEPEFRTVTVATHLVTKVGTKVASGSIGSVGITAKEGMQFAYDKAFDMFHNTMRREPNWNHAAVRFCFVPGRILCEILEEEY